MEFIFIIISLILSLISIYEVGRTTYNHRQLISMYKHNENEGLIIFHIIMGIILMAVYFITLCAFNNTFWHLHYLTK